MEGLGSDGATDDATATKLFPSSICMPASVREPQATRQAQMSLPTRTGRGRQTLPALSGMNSDGDSALRMQRSDATGTHHRMSPGKASPSVRWLPKDRQPTQTLNGRPLATLNATLNWRLTFDMSGVPQTAKPAVERPLDGRVRRHRSTLVRTPARTSSIFDARCSRRGCTQALSVARPPPMPPGTLEPWGWRSKYTRAPSGSSHSIASSSARRLERPDSPHCTRLAGTTT